MYDVGIVGAGPAGSTLARLLADRCRVLLLDSGRRKCCGGILAPEAQKMLAKLDLAVPREVLVDPQPFAVSVLDLRTRLMRRYARQYVNVDRYAFDRWLLSLVPENVDIKHGAVYRHAIDVDSSLEIHYEQDGEPRKAKVRRLVGADGPFSTVRREFFPDRAQPKRYVALQYWYEDESAVSKDRSNSDGIDFSEDYVGIFDPEVTDFYAWSIPKNRHLVLGAAIPYGESVHRKFELLKSKLESHGLHFKEPVRREAGQIVRPLCIRSMFPGSDRVLLVGEAAGLISPSSAEGIGAALASAYQLYRVFTHGDGSKEFDLGEYRRNLRRLRWSLWLKIVKIPFMFHPGLRRCVMLSSLTALDK